MPIACSVASSWKEASTCRIFTACFLTLMKGDERVESIRKRAYRLLLFSKERYADFDFCKFLKFKNLSIFRISLRSSLILTEQVGTLEQPCEKARGSHRNRSCHNVSWANNAIMQTRVYGALPHSHAVVYHVPLAHHLIVDKTRTGIYLPVGIRRRIYSVRNTNREYLQIG